jgi:hypothetical protein
MPILGTPIILGRRTESINVVSDNYQNKSETLHYSAPVLVPAFVPKDLLVTGLLYRQTVTNLDRVYFFHAEKSPYHPAYSYNAHPGNIYISRHWCPNYFPQFPSAMERVTVGEGAASSEPMVSEEEMIGNSEVRLNNN